MSPFLVLMHWNSTLEALSQVKHLGNGLAGDFFPGAPQVKSLSVAVLVALHVELQALLKRFFAQHAVEHADLMAGGTGVVVCVCVEEGVSDCAVKANRAGLPGGGGQENEI